MKNKKISLFIDSLLAGLLLSSSLIEEMFRVLLSIVFGGNNSFPVNYIDSFIFLVIYFFLLFRLFNDFYRPIIIRSLFATLIIGFLFAFSVLVNRNVVMFSGSFLSLIIRFPLYFFFGELLFYKTSIFQDLRYFIILSIFYCLLFIISPNQSDYMVFSYYLLPWTVLSFYFFAKKRKVVFLFIFLFLFVSLMLYGARMPCLITIISAIVFIVLNTRKNRIPTAFASLFALGIFFVAIFTFRKELLTFLDSNGIESKFISRLIEENVFESSQRILVYKYAFNEIKSNLFKIRGFYSDRLFFGDTFYETNALGIWILDNNRYTLYCHNVIIELFFDFGLVLGFFALFAFVVLLIKAFLLFKNTNNSKDILIYLLLVSFLPLLVSNSYLSYSLLWFFVGYLITYHFGNKKYGYQIC